MVRWIGLLAAAAFAAGSAAPRVEAIRAQLFETATGALSPDVLAPGAPGLMNVIAGPQASDSALVVVQAAAPAKSRLRLRAVEAGGKLLLDEVRPLARPGPDGRVQAAFLIRPDGCKAVTLTASLVGRPPGEAVDRIVPYACGE